MVAADPFVGQLVRPERLAEVASPAYDALTITQRRQYRADNPLSYLHVTRSAPDEDDADTVDNATLVARGRLALERLLDADVFADAPGPAYLGYELDTGDHRQRGVVCEISGAEFRRCAKPHEATQASRADLLAEHFTTVRAASSAVACTVADGRQIEEALSTLDAQVPALEHRGDDEFVQRVWRIEDDDVSGVIRSALAAGSLYIVDGHHRAAANGRLLDRGIDVPLLVVVFPPESLRVAGFHRLVRLPGELDEQQFVERVSKRFRVTSHDSLVEPERGSVSIRAAGSWHRVMFDERPVSGSASVRLGSLDPSIVEREIIEAIVARDGQTTDVTYMPDEDGLAAVVAEAERGGRVPILVPPVLVSDMIEVADGGLTMPAKSTYFTPKVRSGLFLRRYDGLLDRA